MDTNRTLLKYDRQIEELAGSVVFEFNKSKINQFYANNGIKLDTLKGRITFLQKGYFEWDENSNTPKYEGVGRDMKPVLLEGKVFEDFKKKLSEIMSEETTIKF